LFESETIEKVEDLTLMEDKWNRRIRVGGYWMRVVVKVVVMLMVKLWMRIDEEGKLEGKWKVFFLSVVL